MVILLLSIKKFVLKVSYQLLSQNEAKDSIWNLYCTLEDENRSVLHVYA